jgi:ABC-type phosphate/phosphonate transport system substrate-binding protein
VREDRRPILIGAVIYAPQVATVWEIIKDYFATSGCPIDYVFYSNYALLVDALLAGHVDIAWNSPLAWVDAQRRSGGTCRAIAMRDTDRNRVTHFLVRRDGGPEGVAGLRGKRVATGAADSPQATLLPLHFLHEQGLEAGTDFDVRRFDVLVGKHGDHVGGELDALRSLAAGESDACAVLDLNWERWRTDGTADPKRLTVLATTPPFDHCNFTVLEGFPAEDERRWTEALFAMRYDDPAHREMMDLEGLKAWLPGRTSGYRALQAAVTEQQVFDGPQGQRDA